MFFLLQKLYTTFTAPSPSISVRGPAIGSLCSPSRLDLVSYLSLFLENKVFLRSWDRESNSCESETNSFCRCIFVTWVGLLNSAVFSLVWVLRRHSFQMRAQTNQLYHKPLGACYLISHIRGKQFNFRLCTKDVTARNDILEFITQCIVLLFPHIIVGAN